MKDFCYLRKSIILLFSVVLLLSTSKIVVGQIPSTFTNLLVLDKKISKSELLEKMKVMSTSLGVRCEFCHVGNPTEGFKSFDFASDEKVNKKTARTMMIMVDDINRTHLKKLGDSSKKVIQDVNCYTCHHNNNKPRFLKTEIEDALIEGGLDLAITRYHELRSKFFGASVYDFTENSLSNIAMELASNGQFVNAIGLLKLNEEQYPESIKVKEFFVRIYLQAEQIPEAITACNKVLKLNPDNKRIQDLLNQLQKN